MFKSNTFCVKMLLKGNTIFNLKITEYGRGKSCPYVATQNEEL